MIPRNTYTKQGKATSAQHFITTDLGLASALKTVGFRLLNIDRANPQRVQLAFEGGEEIEGAASSYYSSALNVDAATFYNEIRTLKSMLYSSL